MRDSALGRNPTHRTASKKSQSKFSLGPVESIREERVYFKADLTRRGITPQFPLALRPQYHAGRSRQGKGTVISFPAAADRIGSSSGPIRTPKRLDEPLEFYHRAAACVFDPKGRFHLRAWIEQRTSAQSGQNTYFRFTLGFSYLRELLT